LGHTKGARTDFAYHDDDGVLVAFRHENRKAMNPYERADIVSDQYDDWRVKNAYLWVG
jgi:arylsulfatase